MERRRLGRTEHESSIAILGAAAFWQSTPEETASAFNEAFQRGVNHLDIAPQYGAAQVLVGPLIPAVRDQIFLACKTLRKNPGGVRAQAEESLSLFGTDYFDLYQMHAVTDLDVLEERVEAAEEILKMRDEGITRFAGITGHNEQVPGAFLEALRRWDLDTVMFPVNARQWSNPDYRRDAEALLEVCAERDLGVMAIKAAARRPWDDAERFATTWYEPFSEPEDVARGVAFTLSVPGVDAFCTPGDPKILRFALDAADSFEPMDEAERESAIASAAEQPTIFPIPTG